MARQAEADGITTVCATPHIRHDHEVRIHELPARVAELNDALDTAEVAVRVVPGGEVAETAVRGLDDDELRAVSLGGGGLWILLEPAPGPLGGSLVKAVRLLERRGFASVIAHPERHALPELPERLRELIDAGALIQLTAALLEDPDATPWLIGLAELGLVHLLGSDAHSATHGRPLELSGGFERLAQVDHLRPHIDWMARDAPAAMLRGEPVNPPFTPAESVL